MFIGIRTMRQFRLDITNRIVTEIADQASMKLGQALGLGYLEALQVILDKLLTLPLYCL